MKRRQLVRARTNDLQGGPPAGDRTRVYTQEEIGPNRALLPNGNLICYSVPLARTGWLIYGPQEVPVAPGERGVAYVERTADTLFAPDTIASFNTAALTLGHPDENVTPENWDRLAGGYTINVRRGTGDDADVLLGDIVVTKKRFIDEILSGLREVSPGYDADYRDRGKGIGSQYNILGNHVALVPRGRCGPRCAIGDAAFQAGAADDPEDFDSNHQESYSMTAANAGAPLARRPLTPSKVELARQRFNDAQAALAEAEAAEDEGAVHVHIHGAAAGDARGTSPTLDAATEERFVQIEGTLGDIKDTLALLVPTRDSKGARMDDDGDDDDDGVDDDDDAAPEGKKVDKKKKTGDAAHKDSAALSTAYTTLASQAEILVPGFKVPTFDAEMTRAKTVDRMCNVRRKVLDQFSGTDAGPAILKAVNGGTAPTLDDLDCAQVASMFKTAAIAKAAANNQAVATRDAAAAAIAAASQAGRAGNPGAMPIANIAAINAQNAKFWEGKQ